MEKLTTWAFIALAVATALTANTIATIWAKSPATYSVWLIALILISPVVFITFGLVTDRTGLLVSSGTIDSLLTITAVLMALIAFREWSSVTTTQLAGIACTITGIGLLHIKG